VHPCCDQLAKQDSIVQCHGFNHSLVDTLNQSNSLFADISAAHFETGPLAVDYGDDGSIHWNPIG
jgi:hypothetical protein